MGWFIAILIAGVIGYIQMGANTLNPPETPKQRNTYTSWHIFAQLANGITILVLVLSFINLNDFEFVDDDSVLYWILVATIPAVVVVLSALQKHYVCAYLKYRPNSLEQSKRWARNEW